ncbi:Uncharacterised protein [BD1-7 clade bacterium]|uniref:Uncharacterized protein n=1 Tax=BD1-7 clade bacterium TaxID=2029982 RepID=A0A5S9QK04_9GAMM|nr:Uncharacterised protein [BD1-7 clade bacterium]
MITYLYWALVFIIAIGAFGFFVRNNHWKAGSICALIVLLIGWSSYFFYFEQVFVKRFGGVMTINVPDGQYHLGSTWKGDNLWIENYDPKKNTCVFQEYSRGHVLEGKVVLKNCNPLVPTQVPTQTRDERQPQTSTDTSGSL